jgi:Cu(I)/Ag(I) efflux system membrane protein CusA/SilA
MLPYLDLAQERRRRIVAGWDDLKQAVISGAVQRLRPKVMTVTMFMDCSHYGARGLARVMKRIAAPMIAVFSLPSC